jgi:hypothetical protein
MFGAGGHLHQVVELVDRRLPAADLLGECGLAEQHQQLGGIVFGDDLRRPIRVAIRDPTSPAGTSAAGSVMIARM